MRFRMFGVDVEVQLSFWIMSVFMSWNRGVRGILVWVAVVFISILVHEYGHALAIRRHRIEPEITLYAMGGLTSWRQILPLRRIDRIVISLAGPFAGFVLFGLVYAFTRFAPVSVVMAVPEPLIADLMWVNLGWGLVNLAPVLPFDGGHVLEEALGPKRTRLTALISFITALGIVAYFVGSAGSDVVRSFALYPALLFGWAAFQSFQRYRAAAAPVRVVQPARPTPAKKVEEPLPPALAETLKSARDALAHEDHERAIQLAEQILAGGTGPGAYAALHVLGWSHLMAGRVERAADSLARAGKIDTPDPALAGAVMLAKGNAREARRIFEAARAAGDDRKEIVGPLIQILIEQREIARAAATAYDIVESLSEEDARRMGRIAFEGSAFDWAARLYEAVFRREGHADDAYEAARALSQGGDTDRAVELLRRAVAAGFSDRARAWSDAALEELRQSDHLEAVLPRP